MNIDTSAPAVARASIEVEAPLEVVWGVLTDIVGWPDWNPDIKSVSMHGSLTAGTSFRWKAGPGTITSTLEAVQAPELIAWRGNTLGVRAVHVHRLSSHDGSTLVQSEESWDGGIVRLLRGPMRKALNNAIESGLRHLKARAEGLSGKHV